MFCVFFQAICMRVRETICEMQNCPCGGMRLVFLRVRESDWDRRRQGTHGNGRLKAARSPTGPLERKYSEHCSYSESLSAEAARGPKVTNNYIIFKETHKHTKTQRDTWQDGKNWNDDRISATSRQKSWSVWTCRLKPTQVACFSFLMC